MARLTDPLFRGLVQGIIEAGVAVRASTAELWAEIRGAANEIDAQLPSDAWNVVNQLRSEATARRTGYERFQRAAPSAEFTAAMAAPESNLRPAEVRDILPEYLARFDLTFTDPTGAEVTRTVSARDSWRPGMTVGDVYDAVAESAEGLANEYGTGLVGFGNIRPVMI